MLDTNLAGMNKHAQFFNLAFKVMKNDSNVPRMIGLLKRLLQISLYQQPHLLCAVLFLVSELMKTREKEAKMFEKVLEKVNKEAAIFKEDDDDDLDDDFKADIDTSDDEENPKPSTSKPKPATSSWVHKNVHKPVLPQKRTSNESYDPHQRNPAFAGADKTNHWELAMVTGHFHPSVEMFATSVLDGKAIKYNGDPLQDFTLMKFLDRFVFRNPKKESAKISNSVFNKRQLYKPKGIKGLAPDSKEYLSKDLDQIPVEERFIYKYLKSKRAKQADEADSDAESVNSEDFNEAIKNVEHDDIDFASNVKDADMKDIEDDEDMSNDDAEEDQEDFDGQEWESLDGEDSDDEEELEKEDFDDEEGSDEELEPPPVKKSKKKASKSDDLQSLLASADEFSALIDENTRADMATDTMNAIFNKDKSHAKQMKWESKRLKQQRKRK